MRGDRPYLYACSFGVERFTPHARGSTVPALFRHEVVAVYPACAGIDRSRRNLSPICLSLPRMRGDRPWLLVKGGFRHEFTPHARGSTVTSKAEKSGASVYPACAGIDLPFKRRFNRYLCLPRMRGDRPKECGYFCYRWWFTPHARGSTSYVCHFPFSFLVYPACAGIDLLRIFLASASVCLPRMRGDRPSDWAIVVIMEPFTPHARGSTCRLPEHTCRAAVYPACAGIDPVMLKCMPKLYSLPRMRGDRPYREKTRINSFPFTPHARGSTRHQVQNGFFGRVYPACAGIDRNSLSVEE